MLEFMLELWAWGKFVELAFGAVMIGASIMIGLGVYIYAVVKQRKLNKK